MYIMIFTATHIPGVSVIDPEKLKDERGFFARTFDAQEFARRGLCVRIAECSTSFNPKKGTLRGMHYQEAPHEEAKIVRCTRGAIYDVALDLRADSPAYKKWVAIELSADNSRMLYIPEGCAHGFQTLEDDAEVFYMMNAPYIPAAASGVRFDDPAFDIEWPRAMRTISDKDQSFPDCHL